MTKNKKTERKALSRKKEEERFLSGLKWELWLGNSMLDSINSLQKPDTKINLQTNLQVVWKPQPNEI